MSMRVSIGVIDPNVSVTYQLPVAAVSYILLGVQAQLDPLNRNPYVSESFAVVDSAAYEAIKALANSVGTADAVQSIDTAKGLNDLVTATMTISFLRTYVRDFDDTVEPVELKALALAQGTRFETISVADDQTLDYEKARFETLSATDVKAVDFSTQRSETVSAQDARSLLVERPESELIVISEADVKEFTKLATDGVGMNDQAEAQDGIALGFATSISNVAFVADSDDILVGKNLSDSPSVDDDGSLFNQGYCDVTYFAEEYVGDSRTFT